MKFFRSSWRSVFSGIVIIMLAGSLLTSCRGKRYHAARKVISSKQLFSSEDFSESLAVALGAAEKVKEKTHLIPDASQAMRSVYRHNDYSPLWVAEDGITDAAELLLKDLDSLRWDGIDPSRYHIEALSGALKDLKKSGDLQAAIAFDTACTKAWLQASRDLLVGLIPPRTADSLWFHSNDSAWDAPGRLVAGLDSGGSYPPLAQYRSRIPTYELLRTEFARYSALTADAELNVLKSSVVGRRVPDSVVEAIVTREFPWIEPVSGDTMSAAAQRIRGIQEHYGLPATGKPDSITLQLLRRSPAEAMQWLAANMERLRWMPQSLENQYVLVNIPLMELFFRKDGQDAFHMKVVVGKPARQTPSLNADMANVVFSPSWGVPPTILKKDVAPGIARTGGSYLARKNLEAFDRRGRKVSAGSVTAENYQKFSFRQPPGEDNALGDVKFNLPNKWDIYLHDTPHREDFDKRYRAKSSGCIRVERPREFAEFILRDMEGREQFDLWKIDSLIQLRKTRYETLRHKIPVHIVYLTAFEDENSSRIRMVTDIYKRDAKLIEALTRINSNQGIALARY